MMEKQRKKILIVEDHRLSAISEMKMLQKAGYEVIHFFNGEDAVEFICKDIKIDLILMDIDLGEGICGITAARSILRIKSIPLVFFTSHTESEVEKLTGDFNCYNYLSKYSPAHLLRDTLDKIFSVVREFSYTLDR